MLSNGNNIDTDEQIEALRCILERTQCRNVAFDEAREVGASLVRFYELLANNQSPKGL